MYKSVSSSPSRIHHTWQCTAVILALEVERRASVQGLPLQLHSEFEGSLDCIRLCLKSRCREISCLGELDCVGFSSPKPGVFNRYSHFLRSVMASQWRIRGLSHITFISLVDCGPLDGSLVLLSLGFLLYVIEQNRSPFHRVSAKMNYREFVTLPGSVKLSKW